MTLRIVGFENNPCDRIVLFDGNSLDGWKITIFGGEGEIYLEDSTLVLSMGEGLTGLTWQQDFPVIGYRISLEARRTKGTDFFCGLTFPVNQQFCSLIVGGWGGTLVGISNIDGNDAARNFTKNIYPLGSQEWYKIDLKVTTDSIQAWIDDEQVVAFFHPRHQLSVRTETLLSRPLGIASWNTTAEIRNFYACKL
jgi:hypothetical protein